MDFDNSKTYVYFEDNQDGTSTMTINVVDQGNGVEGKGVVVLSMSLVEMMETLIPEEIRRESYDRVSEIATVIPDTVD